MEPFYDFIFFTISFLPLLFLDILQYIFWSFLSCLLNFLSKIFLLAMTEIVIRGLLYIPDLYDPITVPRIEADDFCKTNKTVQTCGPWQKRIRSQEKHYTELKKKTQQEARGIRSKRLNLLRKGKDKLTKFKRDIDGKAKMLTGVKIQLLHLGSEIQTLLHRIRENRQLLEIKRTDNKRIVERYEQINSWLNSNIRASLPDRVVSTNTPAITQ